MEEVIELSFTLSEAEYCEAQSLYIRAKQPWIRVLLPVCILVGTLLVVLTNLLKSFRDGSPVDWASVILSLAVAFVFLALLHFARRRGFRRRFKIEAPNLTNVIMQLDDSGVRIQIAGRGEGTTQWPTFSTWSEGDKVFIMISGFTFRPIPKSVLSPTEVDAIRNLLTLHIKKAGVAEKS
jgi:uncharacterized membrane protein